MARSRLADSRAFLVAMAALAAGVAPSLAAPAAWQPIRDTGGLHGTMACTADGSFCFGLACRRGEPMHWMVRITGGLLPARGEITVSVDGSRAGTFAYRAEASAAVTTAEARYSSVQHAAIADALKRGRQATVAMSGLNRAVGVPLKGAAREIERTFARCGVPEGEPVRPMTVPPTETRDHGALSGAVFADRAAPPGVGAGAFSSRC